MPQQFLCRGSVLSFIAPAFPTVAKCEVGLHEEGGTWRLEEMRRLVYPKPHTADGQAKQGEYKKNLTVIFHSGQ